MKNTHTEFEACSYNSFRDMRDLSQNFHFSAKWSLFSDPVTYAEGLNILCFLLNVGTQERKDQPLLNNDHCDENEHDLDSKQTM